MKNTGILKSFSSVQSLSHVQFFVIPMDCSPPDFSVHHQLPELAQTHSHNRWCHPTISCSAVPVSSCLQSFPASGSFLSQFFTSGGQSIGASALASVLPMNIQDQFPLGWTGLISLQSKGLSRVFSTTVKSINSSVLSFLKELKDIVISIPLGNTRILPQGCTMVSCLCIASLPGLTTIQICPLELREGHGVWSLFPIRNRRQKGFRAQKPHRVLLICTPYVKITSVTISQWLL